MEQVNLKNNSNQVVITNQKSNTEKRILSNNIAKYTSMTIACLFGVILFAILGFIIYRAVEGFSAYGADSIFGDQFNFSNEQVSFWLPFFATVLTTFIALLIAVPIGIKSAVFIKFRVHKRYKKLLRVIIETLAGIPSVIFGLFASQSFAVIYEPLGISSYSILSASVMLAFMVLPTIMAMSTNALENVDGTLLINPIALGTTKTKAIYKVYKKAARNGILVGVVLAMGRAIGETMALSMLLTSENDYVSAISGGLGTLLASNIKTVSVVISTNMYGENATIQGQSLLFAFGLILFLMIMIFNIIIVYLTRDRKNKKNTKYNMFLHDLKTVLTYIPNAIIYAFEYICFKPKRTYKIENVVQVMEYTKVRNEEYKLKNLYSYYKIFWEVVCISLCFIFLSWLIVEIVGFGINSWTLDSSSVFDYSKNTTGQAFFNTLLIIFVAILIALPFSLVTAVYLNEFNKSNKFKRTINFFLDSLGATPSILFGMFGLLFFIQTLGWTSSGATGYSLIAGALTVTLVILPSFTRGIQQALVEIPNEIRINSLALGCSVFHTVKKIILPAAIKGIITSIILAIGRVLSETAPLYLTAGLTSSSVSALDRSGQTLTTRIYAQLQNTNVSQATNIMYESAFLTLLLVLTLIVIGYYIVPNWKAIKKSIVNGCDYLRYKFNETFKKNKNKQNLEGVTNS